MLHPFEFSGTPNFSQSSVGGFLKIHQNFSTGNSTSYFRLSAQYGLSYGIFSSVIIQYFLGGSTFDLYGSEELFSNSTFSYLVLASTFLYFCIRHFRKRNSGVLTLKRGIAIGAVFGLISGVVLAIFSYIYYLEPSRLDSWIGHQIVFGGYDQYSREKILELFFIRILMSIPTSLLYGLVSSFFLSLFLRTK